MPLTFDMPFDLLREYKGSNPKPEDHGSFWEAGLAEMHSLDPMVEFIPADFQVAGCECFHLYFTGVQGARVHAKYLRPSNAKTPHPAVLMFHGYTGNAGEWQDKLSYVSQGFSVAALDCRGQGGRSEDIGGVQGNTHHGHIIRGLEEAVNGSPKNLLYRQIFLDTAQLAKIIMGMAEVDPDRVGALGGSQGGALTVACAALEPRIKRAAPVYPFLSDYKRVWSIDQAKDAYSELNEYFRLFDPTHKRENEIFNTLGYIDIQHLASRIKAEIYWGIGLMDTICPPSSQFAVYNKIVSPKFMEVYPDFGHENLPGHNDSSFLFMMGLK